LLEVSDNRKGSPIKLEHLEVQHAVRCRVTNQNNETEEGTYTVIRCLEADEELSHYFLHTVDPLLRLIGSSPTPLDISRSIEHLVELFRALTQAPIKSVSGLWAELFVIRNANQPAELLRAWHTTPHEKFDFNAGGQRIEVKSTSQGMRLHHFSLEQLNPPADTRVLIASTFMEKTGAGTSLEELIEEIRSQLGGDAELEERLNRVVALTLGISLQQGLTQRFDKELARQSLRVFDASVIPKLSNPLPDGISDVHFQSDLSRSTPLSKRELRDAGGIFARLESAIS
jgi:hypothetical protein